MFLKNKITYGYIVLILSGAFMACTQGNNNHTEIIKPLIQPASVNPYAAVDKSPMDMSYYPVNYPMQLMSGNDSSGLVARVIYSRPQKNGRVVFSNDPSPKSVQQYGTYWRLGANEATEIEFFKPVTVEGRKIAKGRYLIYCIPYEDKWTMVFNTNLYDWGLHPDTARDIARVDIPVTKTTRSIEYFTMVFQQSPTGADLVMAWDSVKAALPISF